MNSWPRSALFAATFLCAVLAANDAQAQFGGGMGGGRRGGGDGSSRGADSTAAKAARPSLSDRLDQLAPQLMLSAAQGRSWDAFRAAFMALQRPVGGTVALSDSASAMRAMQLQLSQAQDHFTLVEALSDALKKLDGELDPQQRAVEDRLVPPLLTEFTRPGAGRDRLP
jgi:hypothetical protein